MPKVRRTKKEKKKHLIITYYLRISYSHIYITILYTRTAGYFTLSTYHILQLKQPKVDSERLENVLSESAHLNQADINIQIYTTYIHSYTHQT
jgi:hypothetical protein